LSLRRRALHGIAWSAGLSIATQPLNFAMMSLLARALGRHAFGEWGILQSTLGTIAAVAQLSVSTAATRYVAELRHRDPHRAGAVLGLLSAVSLVTAPLAAIATIAVSGPLAAELLGTPALAGPVQMSALYLLLLTMNGFQQGALAGLERFRPLALLGLLYGVASLVLVPTMGRAFGVSGAVLGLALATLASWIGHHLVLRRLLREAGITVSYRAARRERGVLFDFTVPATVAGIASMVGIWLSNVFLVHQPAGYEQMASLAAATNLKGLVLFAPTITSRVSAPLLTNLLGNRDHETYRYAFSRNLLLTTFGTFVLAAAVALSGKYLLLFFGRDFEGAAPMVAILALSGVLEVAALGLYQHIFSAGWMWSTAVIVILRSVALVAVSRALVGREGAIGIAWANVVSQAVALLASYWVVRARFRLEAPATPGSA
jgi:O-antigen/teichoic acid export membrane protein